MEPNNTNQTPDAQSANNEQNESTAQTHTDAQRSVDEILQQPATIPNAQMSAESEPRTPKGVVRTYSNDVRDLVRGQKLSLARMVATQERANTTPEILLDPKEESRWKSAAVVSIILLLVAIAAVVLVSVYKQNNINNQSAAIVDGFAAIMFTEAHKTVELQVNTTGALSRTLGSARMQTFPAIGTFVDFVVVHSERNADGVTQQTQLRTPEFMRDLSGSVPNDFISTLDNEYMVGVHALADITAPFIVLTTHSYSDAFSGMIAWEKTMLEDLSPFFDRGILRDTVTVAIEGDGSFEDLVLQNMDTRVLRDAKGNIIIAYTFIDRGTIIVAGDIRTLVAVATRARIRTTN